MLPGLVFSNAVGEDVESGVAGGVSSSSMFATGVLEIAARI